MLKRIVQALCTDLLLAAAAVALAHEIGPLKPLEFVPPQPGSYSLQRIMHAPDGMVLGTDNKPQKLSHFTSGKVTLLSFIYSSCTDPKGCPLAYQVFNQLKQEIQNSPQLHDRVRFVSLSFDPRHDTPQVMKLYGSHAVNVKGVQWYFLTTRSPKELLPLLEGFGQDVLVAIDPETGKPAPALSHVLKVFLIDKRGAIREIYTTSFLLPQIVLNDIQTLLLEDGRLY